MPRDDSHTIGREREMAEVARASEALPDFNLAERNAATIAQICRCLPRLMTYLASRLTSVIHLARLKTKVPMPLTPRPSTAQFTLYASSELFPVNKCTIQRCERDCAIRSA
jgi:hypothetical protein